MNSDLIIWLVLPIVLRTAELWYNFFRIIV